MPCREIPVNATGKYQGWNLQPNLGFYGGQLKQQISGLQIFFLDWWAEVTQGAKNGGSFSEMMGPSISN